MQFILYGTWGIKCGLQITLQFLFHYLEIREFWNIEIFLQKSLLSIVFINQLLICAISE